MPDTHTSKQTPLSEISHLFLSSVRGRQTDHAPLPRRIPPAPDSNVSIDMTPEEFAKAHAENQSDECAFEAARTVPISALIASHFQAAQSDRARQVARHLAATGQRVGWIELDETTARVCCFEMAALDETTVPDDRVGSTTADPRQITEALGELNWDVDQWLLLIKDPKTAEARRLLALVNHWMVLSACDHDGVIASYRALKGLSGALHPTLSIALLGARGPGESDAVFKKLSGVCQQFLGWKVAGQQTVEDAPNVNEHQAISFHAASLPDGSVVRPQWNVIEQFVREVHLHASPVRLTNQADASHAGHEPTHKPTPADTIRNVRTLAEVVVPSVTTPESKSSVQIPERAFAQQSVQSVALPETVSDEPVVQPEHGPMRLVSESSNPGKPNQMLDEVIDLPGIDVDDAGLLSAIMVHSAGELVQCPVAVGVYQAARLAVTRQGRLVLLASARTGLVELPMIGQAYQWLIDNQGLIRMALPQLNIRAVQHPELRLFVPDSDRAAHPLRTMFASEHVTVQTYRKLSWHGKAGLLLQAA